MGTCRQDQKADTQIRSHGGGRENKPAKPKVKLWELRTIAGESGETRRSKQYRILWEDKSVTWEPEADLHNAKEAIKAWTELSSEDTETTKGWNKEKLWKSTRHHK